MNEKRPGSENELPDQPQQLTGFLTNEEWDALLVHVGEQLKTLEELPYPNVKEDVFATLANIDTIHREGLRRLVRLFKKGVLEQVVTDPAIHTLMEMYDLLPPDKKLPEPQRVQVRHVPGSFKSNTQSENTSPPETSQSQFPHWVPLVLKEEDLEGSQIHEVDADGRRLLVCQVESSTYVIDANCLVNHETMVAGTLSKFNLNCPHHRGCYYDIRDGRRIGQAGQLECYPTKQRDDGRILVGMNMSYRPELPAF